MVTCVLNTRHIYNEASVIIIDRGRVSRLTALAEKNTCTIKCSIYNLFPLLYMYTPPRTTSGSSYIRMPPRTLVSTAMDDHASSLSQCIHAYTLSSAQQKRLQILNERSQTNSRKIICAGLTKIKALRATSRPCRIPLGDLHGAVLVKVLVHVEGVPQKVRLVAPALAQALELSAVQVVGQNGLVVGMGALLDDFAGTLAGRHAGDIGEADFGDDHVDWEGY
jgi:hypothetical protein